MKTRKNERDTDSLAKTYYCPKKPASFTYKKPLKYALNNLSDKKIKKWLSEQETHAIHKPVKRNFVRRNIIVSGIDDQWQSDLADLSNISRQNNGYKYLLGCIDVFSKYAWVVPLKSKSAKDVRAGLEHIFSQGRKPRKIQCDQGTEYINGVVQKFLKNENVKFFYTQNQDIKASVVERWWRTLKMKMFRYFTYKGTKKYIDILNDLVHSYNHTYHRSIKTTPAAVNKANEEVIWQRLYGGCAHFENTKPIYTVGTYVRISKLKGKFEKGYLPNWSREIFLIKEIKHTSPVTFILEDQNREELEGSFYSEELQRVETLPNEFRIEAILEERKKGKKKQVLVKWLDYPDSFNSWIDASEVKKY